MPGASRGRETNAPAAPGPQGAIASLLLALLVLAVYGRTYAHAFVEFDDPGYVSENLIVQRGLTLYGIGWAFTTGHMWNWHPLTWLSHMLDVELFGLRAGAHHLVSVAIHLANTLLLFALLRRLTRALWPSFVVAALFGVHPLHVESVAWVAERKDVLSGTFFLLTLWAYGAYAATRSGRWYATALLAFALGLMTKPMLVTLPFVLLLLDVWPLGRLALPARAVHATGRAARRRAGATAAEPPASTVPLWPLVLEKLPFLALTIAGSVVTYVAQWSAGAMEMPGALPLSLRFGNAVVAYIRYLVLTVWPVDLAVFYPYDMQLPAAQVLGATLCLILITALVAAVARRHPYAAVGWLLYTGMLVPVIGLVQVGSQAYADRYTYLPLIGIFIIVAWGGRDLLARVGARGPITAALLAAVIGGYAALAWAQVGLWRNGESLLAHTARVTRANYLAHNNLGVALEAQGRLDAAIEQYREALRIKPDYEHARSNLAYALRGRYEQAVAANPGDATARYHLATALRNSGDAEAAIAQYQEAVRLRADFADAHADLAGVLLERGQADAAIAHYQEAIRAEPDDLRARYNFGSALARTGRMHEAVEQYQHVVRVTPNDADAWGNLAMAYAGLRQTADVERAQRRAVELARAQERWSLVQTLEDWLASYRAQSP